MIEIEQLASAEPEDIERLMALARGLHEDERSFSAAEVLRITQDPNTVFLVLRDEKRIVGVAFLYILQRLGNRTSYVEDVIVDSSYRGQGLGKKLMLALIEEARRRDVASISLTSRPERVAAHKLYDSLGFKKRNSDVFKLSLM